MQYSKVQSNLVPRVLSYPLEIPGNEVEFNQVISMTCRYWIPKIPFTIYSVLWCWYWSQQACDWNVHRRHVLVYLGADGTSLWMPGCGSVSREENSVLTSSPGFSPTCPMSLVPWERGWIHDQCFLYPPTDVQLAKAHPFNTPPLSPPPWTKRGVLDVVQNHCGKSGALTKFTKHA